MTPSPQSITVNGKAYKLGQTVRTTDDGYEGVIRAIIPTGINQPARVRICAPNDPWGRTRTLDKIKAKT